MEEQMNRMFACLEEITAILKELRGEKKEKKPKKKRENYGECCKLANSDFEKLFYIFQEYRTRMGYKPLIAKEAWIRTLKKLSNENKDVAKHIVAQSMANGYQGIFKIKGKYNSDEELFERIAKQVQCKEGRCR